VKIFVIAGEPSGDALGQAAMAGLRALRHDVTFQGVGGPLMTAQGLDSLFPMSDLSVMGLAEIVPKYPHLRRRLTQTVDAVLASGADVLLTIDSPDFCLRVAKRVRARSRMAIHHYVAPSVWAWRPGRAARMAPHVDHVLALLPFEPPLMRAAGMTCDFVGHPVVAQPQASVDDIAAFRARVGAYGPLILALPGSRAGEVARLAPRFGAALSRVVAARPGARVIVPAAAAVEGQVRRAVADWPGDPLLIGPEDGVPAKRAAFAAADIALAASGTVSLELAAAATPMVIAYDLAWLSRIVMSRMLRIDTVTLVNLVSDTRAVPEFIGDACRPGPIADALLATLAEPDTQRAAMALTMDRLGQGGEAPGLRAARSILAHL